MNHRAFVRQISAILWPPGAVILLDSDDWKAVCQELAEDPEEPIVTVAGAPIPRTPDPATDELLAGLAIPREERSAVQLVETERYDRGAYQRVNEVVNERIRPIGTHMDPYHCAVCGADFLWVGKKTKAVIVCDSCGGYAERTST